jgi:hypothetical protein
MWSNALLCIKALLKRRISLLKEAYAPFGSPNDTSRSKVRSGNVKLVDEPVGSNFVDGCTQPGSDEIETF